MSSQRKDTRAYLPLHPPGPRDVFWRELDPSEHLLQVYERDSHSMNALEGFVAGGFAAGAGVVVIASAERRALLEQRLDRHPPYGFNVASLRRQERYFPLDAAETIRACVGEDGLPRESLFREVVGGAIARASGGRDSVRRRKVRIFGELVAAAGELVAAREISTGSSVRMAHLWHELSRMRDVAFFNIYPRDGFAEDTQASIRAIFEGDTKVIPG